PLPPPFATLFRSGLEGASIALDLGAGVNGRVGDANSLAALVVSAIPVGATLSDGSHSFTATAGNTSVDVHGWNLAGLAITPTSEIGRASCRERAALDADGKP